MWRKRTAGGKKCVVVLKHFAHLRRWVKCSNLSIQLFASHIRTHRSLDPGHFWEKWFVKRVNGSIWQCVYVCPAYGQLQAIWRRFASFAEDPRDIYVAFLFCCGSIQSSYLWSFVSSLPREVGHQSCKSTPQLGGTCWRRTVTLLGSSCQHTVAFKEGGNCPLLCSSRVSVLHYLAVTAQGMRRCRVGHSTLCTPVRCVGPVRPNVGRRLLLLLSRRVRAGKKEGTAVLRKWVSCLVLVTPCECGGRV